MPNVVFFSFTEVDRGVVLTIKGRAVNPLYSNLNFRVKDLLKRWNTEDTAVIQQAITKAMNGTSRTIVFVGEKTYLSRWVREEVKMTLENDKPVYAIRLNGTSGITPTVLEDNSIHLYPWSEERLQELATR
jgi:hypothetical protein